MHTDTALAWFRLNTDGLLIAFLAFISALDFIDPNTHLLSVALGYVPPLLYVWTTCYVVGGLLMIYSFLRHRITTEVFGRVFIFMALLLETYREIFALGFTQLVMSHVAILIVLGVLFAVRLSVLFPKKGIAFLIPARER